MTIDDQTRDEKLQYDINREAAKKSALSLGKIDKYEYLPGEEVLSSNQQQIIEQPKFTYYPLGKAFEKHTKTIEDQGRKQVDALESLKSLKPKEVKPIKSDDFYIDKMAEILNSAKETDFNNLTYNFNGESAPISFFGFNGDIMVV